MAMTWTHFSLDMDFDCDHITALAKELGEAFNRSILACKRIHDRVVDIGWRHCGSTLLIHLDNLRAIFISLTLPRDRGRLAAIYTAAKTDKWIRDIKFLSRHLEEEAQHLYPSDSIGDVVMLRRAIASLVLVIKGISDFAIHNIKFFVEYGSGYDSDATIIQSDTE